MTGPTLFGNTSKIVLILVSLHSYEAVELTFQAGLADIGGVSVAHPKTLKRQRRENRAGLTEESAQQICRLVRLGRRLRLARAHDALAHIEVHLHRREAVAPI